MQPFKTKEQKEAWEREQGIPAENLFREGEDMIENKYNNAFNSNPFAKKWRIKNICQRIINN